MEINESQKAPFIKINCILEALKKRDLGPALTWAKDNRYQIRRNLRNRRILSTLLRHQLLPQLTKPLNSWNNGTLLRYKNEIALACNTIELQLFDCFFVGTD